MIFPSKKTNDKIIEVLKRKYGYTEDMVKFLQTNHNQTIVSIYQTEVAYYMDQRKDSADYKYLDNLIRPNQSYKDRIENGQKLISFVFETYNKYPELKELIDSRVDKLNAEHFDNIMSNMDEDSVVEILTVMKEEAPEWATLEQNLKLAQEQ